MKLVKIMAKDHFVREKEITAILECEPVILDVYGELVGETDDYLIIKNEQMNTGGDNQGTQRVNYILKSTIIERIEV